MFLFEVIWEAIFCAFVCVLKKSTTQRISTVYLFKSIKHGAGLILIYNEKNVSDCDAREVFVCPTYN